MRISLSAVVFGLALMPVAVFAQTAAPAPTTAPAVTQQITKMPESPEAKARWEAFRAACGADLKTHCATVATGTEQSRTEMRQCIEANKTKFSASCQSAVAARDANREARKQAQPAVGDKPKT
jgi:hypothetical protein